LLVKSKNVSSKRQENPDGQREENKEGDPVEPEGLGAVAIKDSTDAVSNG